MPRKRDTPEGEGKKETEDKKSVPTYPLIRFADIPQDTKSEIIDLVTGVVERYIADSGKACKAIKEEMDKVYGPFWHVIVGCDFGFDVAYQTNHLLYMFFAGTLGILLWKSS